MHFFYLKSNNIRRLEKLEIIRRQENLKMQKYILNKFESYKTIRGLHMP